MKTISSVAMNLGLKAAIKLSNLKGLSFCRGALHRLCVESKRRVEPNDDTEAK